MSVVYPNVGLVVQDPRKSFLGKTDLHPNKCGFVTSYMKALVQNASVPYKTAVPMFVDYTTVNDVDANVSEFINFSSHPPTHIANLGTRDIGRVIFQNFKWRLLCNIV